MRVVLRNSWKRLLCAAGVVAFAAGCGAYKNGDERRDRAARERARAAELDAGRAITDCPNPQRCEPEPIPEPANCDAAEKGLEFFSPAVWDFTSRSPYSYDDGSTGNGGSALNRPTANDTIQDGIASNRIPYQRCADRAEDTVFRIWGGPFMAWGGGLGTSILDFNREVRGEMPCSNGVASINCSSSEQWLQVRTLDVSDWDGISFWARRGTESQGAIRVALGDKYTDDDLNVDASPPQEILAADRSLQRLGEDDGIDVEQKQCKRARVCSCDGNRPCTLNEKDGLHYCYDPRYETPPTGTEDLCGEDACNAWYATQQFEDPSFYGRACTPHVTASGKAGSYCFNPGEDPEPAENYESCGDHWTKGITLSGDWRLYLVPFSDLRQQGYGQEAPRLLTDQISIVRFTWAAGFIDYYLDDVRFYRVAR
jgi:hypothetical protein